MIKNNKRTQNKGIKKSLDEVFNSEKKLLKKILKYKNKEIIERFVSDYGVSKKFAENLFINTLKFLWMSDVIHKYNHINNLKAHRVQFGIRDSLKIIDEMWHTFICFTQDYELFGFKYFNKYFHHGPGMTLDYYLKGGLKKWLKSQEDFNHSEDWLMIQKLVRKHLGMSTYKDWFINYKKYDDIKIKQLQLDCRLRQLS